MSSPGNHRVWVDVSQYQQTILRQLVPTMICVCAQRQSQRLYI